MNNKQRILGLLGLFVLLLLASSLLQQIKYYGLIAVLLFAVTLLAVNFLWKYLLRNKIITITWASVPYEAHFHKSERLFLFSPVVLISPMLRLHDLTTADVLFTGVALLVGAVAYMLNEHCLAKKKTNS